MNSRSTVLRLAVVGLLIARSPRWLKQVIAFAMLGVALLVAVIVFAVSARGEGLADEKVRTVVCRTLQAEPPYFPIEFTKEWYEHDCKIVYATHGGYAPGAREENRSKRKARRHKRQQGKWDECGVMRCDDPRRGDHWPR